MRAGRLDRSITIQSLGTTVNDYGTPVEVWSPLATVRAQIITATTEEYLRAYGETDSLAVVFRIRWLAGVAADHRVQYEGRNLNIREMKELGRRQGLELRCEEVRS